MKKQSCGLLAIAFLLNSIIAFAAEEKTSPVRLNKADAEAEYIFLKSNIEGFAGSIGQGKKGIETLLAENPNSAYLHFIFAQYLLASNQDPQEAIEECELSLRLDPKAVEVKTLLARLYASQASPAKAAALFEEVAKQKPDDQEITMLLAQEYVRLKQYQKALNVVQRLLSQTEPFPEAYMFMASVYADYLKNTPQAVMYFQKALQVDPNYFAAYDAMAQLYMDHKQPTKALQVLKDLSKKDPQNPTLGLRIALIYYEQKKYGEAIAELNELLQKFPTADKVRYYLGTVYQELEQIDGAREAFLGIPVDSMYFRESRIRLIAQYKKMGQHEEAKKILQDTIAQQKDVALYYELLAAFYDEEKNYAQAVEVLEQGIDVLPKDERLRLLLAMLYERSSQQDKALQLMKDVVKLNPENPTALNYIAYIYAEKGKSLSKAEDMARHAAELEPEDAYIADTLGWVLFKQGRFNEAKAVLEAALALVPNEPTILYHLGEVLLAEKDPAAAREQFLKARKAWQEQPLNEQTAAELEKLEQRLKELEK